MSELKVHRFITTDELFPEANAGALYYDKSEADKVIAEKDAEIARLKAICKVHIEAIESMGAGLLQNDEEIRHQKYKRCLAMARKCVDGDNQLKKIKMRDMNSHQFWQFNNDYWKKWRNRWLEIAEQFKEAK